MSQILEQQLSALLDGELPAEELDLLLTRLDREPARRATLARYAMIGEYLRGGGTPSALGVAERVRTALLETQSPSVLHRQAPAWRGWLAGGMAAAAAVVAVLTAGPGMWGLKRTEPARSQAATLLMDEPLTSVTTAANHRLTPDAAARLTGYLVAHGQYTNQLSRSTFDSHLVAARAERASWRQPEGTSSGP